MSERRKIMELFDKQKDFMEQKVEYGIENHRKGFAGITIKDSEGNIVPGAKISVNQKTHEFKFGANLFMLDEFESEEKNEIYRQKFADVFNMATLPFYWNSTEPEKGNLRYEKNASKMYRRPPIDLCMEYCEKYGIEPREHALAYDGHFPDWLKNASVSEVKTELERRYKEISERYKDKIRTIEVTNEMLWSTYKTEFYNEPDYLEWCYKLAEKYFPTNQIAINEAPWAPWNDVVRVTNKYYSYIENTILKGARIDAVGMQYHMFFRSEDEYNLTRPFYNPENLYKCMDLFARFNLPLQITEITIPAYSNDAEDEALQAEIIEKLYSIWFSHPNMEQIIYWNVVDGYAHVIDPDPEKIRKSQGDMTLGENYYYGGLMRFDMSEKPAFKAIKNLIKNKWHTQSELVSDADGKATFKGFYGKYDVVIEANGKRTEKEIDLKSKGTKCFVLEV